MFTLVIIVHMYMPGIWDCDFDCFFLCSISLSCTHTLTYSISNTDLLWCNLLYLGVNVKILIEVLINQSGWLSEVKAYQAERSQPGVCLVLLEVLIVPMGNHAMSMDQNTWVLAGCIRFSPLLNKWVFRYPFHCIYVVDVAPLRRLLWGRH